MTDRYIEIDSAQFAEGTRQARHDWAVVTGRPVRLRPSVYRDIRNRDLYTNIVGAIAYPTMAPGCLIIIGITPLPGRIFRTLEFREYTQVTDLLSDAVLLRRRWGWGLDKIVLREWVGDERRFLTIVSRLSQELERKLGRDTGLYIKDPVDYREQYAFPLYMRQIRQALKTGQLKIEHTALIDRLQAMQHDAAERGRIEDYPAAGILGGLINTIITEEPWVEDADGGAFNTPD